MKRFIVRDIETKEIRRVNFNLNGQKGQIKDCDFSSANAANQYINSLPFGLWHFYEICDTENNKIVNWRDYMHMKTNSKEKLKGKQR